MKPEYLPFYLDGRDAKGLRVEADDLVDAVIKLIKGGADVWTSIREVAVDAARPFTTDMSKRKKFLRDGEDEVKEAGGDESAAWDAFCAGKIDELAAGLEPAVVEAIEDEVSGDDGDDDEDDDDAEDDDNPAT